MTKGKEAHVTYYKHYAISKHIGSMGDRYIVWSRLYRGERRPLDEFSTLKAVKLAIDRGTLKRDY